jgi:hypothetical protein
MLTMVRSIALTTALSTAIAVSVTLPAPGRASAEDAPANIADVSMLVDAKINGKDVWSPGGRELDWQASKCPLKIQFKAMVQVDKPAKITYRWERSDGEVLPTQTFELKKGGEPVEVVPPDVWTVGKSGAVFRGAETLHVLTPGDMSTTTPIKVECQ